MAYDKTKYGTWRLLKLDKKTALALADDAAPKTIPAVMSALADIADPATATAEDCATKINALLAKLRTAGYLHT